MDILIVDDTPANLNVLSAIFSKQGYRVRVAPNGERALKTVAKAAPDIILLDIQMPDLNGYDVCRHLKSDDTTKHIPIIFISALDEVMDKVEAFEAGAVDYISKPFQIEEVLARVENHLTLRRQHEQIAVFAQALHQLQKPLHLILDYTQTDAKALDAIRLLALEMQQTIEQVLPEHS